MPNAFKNNLVISLYFGKVLPPARRIGQLLGSNPSAEAGDVGMGPYFIVRPFFLALYAYVGNALNPGGLGAGPHLNKSAFLCFIENVLQLVGDSPATDATFRYCRIKSIF